MSAPVVIMAGGTGGHVFPALAAAKVLRERGIPVVWLGVPDSMEARLVPANGFPIEWDSRPGPWRRFGSRPR
jgi:UDP-N-acetylglucosamine--N-acetylmuramyl-(pentapeptide) pyrophosphoryl-undecaprenol N-acetylglucosamine transferase